VEGQKLRRSLRKILSEVLPPVAFEIFFGRVVRTTGPNWYQLVLDIAVKR